MKISLLIAVLSHGNTYLVGMDETGVGTENFEPHPSPGRIKMKASGTSEVGMIINTIECYAPTQLLVTIDLCLRSKE